MKKLILPLLVMPFLFASCSGDDNSNSETNNNNNNGDNDVATADYLPLQSGNYWVYDVESQSATGRDSLYISGNETINGNVYNKFMTPAPPFGFYSAGLYDNGMRQVGDKLVVTGDAQFFFSEQIPFSVAVSDFVVFKEHTTDGQVLGTTSGSLNQTINGYNIIIDYNLSTTAKENLDNYTVAGTTYQHVKKVQTILNLRITSPFVISGITYQANIMNPQNVIVSTQYFAKDIGVVHVETDINYNLLQVPGVTLPVPQSFSDHQEETLDHYNAE